MVNFIMKEHSMTIKFLPLFLIVYMVLLSINGGANTITITINNLKPNKGVLYVSLISNERSFYKILNNKTSILNQAADIFSGMIKDVDSNTTETISLANIPTGNYSILVFQDLNDNKKLDEWIFGPVEPYGFSNNLKASTGPPTFSDTLINISHQINSYFIKMK